MSQRAFAVMAASSRYNGGWPSAIGLCLTALGLMLLGCELDEYRAGRQEGVMIVVVFAMGSMPPARSFSMQDIRHTSGRSVIDNPGMTRGFRNPATVHAMSTGMTTPSPRMAAAVAMPSSRPSTSTNAPPANPTPSP